MEWIERRTCETFGVCRKELRHRYRGVNANMAWSAFLCAAERRGNGIDAIIAYTELGRAGARSALEVARGLFATSPIFKQAVTSIVNGIEVAAPELERHDFGGKDMRLLLNRVFIVAGVSPKEILSDIRTKRVAEARWAVMLALRRRGAGPTHIGRVLRRDHATVGSGLKRGRALYLANAEYRAVVDEVMRDS